MTHIFPKSEKEEITVTDQLKCYIKYFDSCVEEVKIREFYRGLIK